MLSLGLSKPWQEALETMTGSKQMDATAIIDYFAPLKKFMDEELAKKGVKVQNDQDDHAGATGAGDGYDFPPI